MKPTRNILIETSTILILDKRHLVTSGGFRQVDEWHLNLYASPKSRKRPSKYGTPNLQRSMKPQVKIVQIEQPNQTNKR